MRDSLDLAHRRDHMHGNADGSAVIGQRPRNRLADPPRGVRGKAKSPGVFELVGSPNQAGVSFLDQVEQADAAVLVTAGNRDHEPKIGGYEVLPGLFVFVAAAASCVRDSGGAWRGYAGSPP